MYLNNPGSSKAIEWLDDTNYSYVNMDSTSSSMTMNAWNHVQWSIDTLNGLASLYINNTLKENVSKNSKKHLSWDQDDHYVGTHYGTSSVWSGDMGEMWVDNVYTEMDTQSNRDKWRDSTTGDPIDLGGTGEIPTGGSPMLFLSGPTVNWHNNKGTGYGYTEIGALTDGAQPAAP